VRIRALDHKEIGDALRFYRRQGLGPYAVELYKPVVKR
jgi:hypothetical protein